jgi:hypothetical protein
MLPFKLVATTRIYANYTVRAFVYKGRVSGQGSEIWFSLKSVTAGDNLLIAH